jgi:cytochrome c-type biogenesis protein CcmH/NrfG
MFAPHVLLSAGGFDEVADGMKAWVDKHPDSVDGWIALGNARARLNSSTNALARLAMSRTADELRTAAQSAPRKITAAADASAADAFRRAMDLAPDNAAARIAWANFLVATEHVEEGMDVLDKVVTEGPTLPVVNHAVGTYYWLHGRSAEAETCLKAAAGASGYARRPAATSNLASLYEATGRKAEAIAAIRALPPEPAVTDTVTLSLARLEAGAGDLDAALRRLDGLSDRKGQQSGALAVKASLLLDAGRLPDAVAAARTAADQSPSEAEPRVTLGKALLASGDVENAFDAFDAASRLTPGDARLALDLVRVALELGHTDDYLLTRAQDAANLLPEDPEALAAPAAVLLARNDVRSAERALSPSLRKHPSSPELLILMGQIEEKLKRPEEARMAYLRALRASPGSADAISGLAFLDIAQGQFDEARRRIDEALPAHSTDADYLYATARIHQAAGDGAGREQLLRRTLDANPAQVSAALDLLSPDFVQAHAAEAVRILERLLDKRPRAIEARERLAGIYERAGRGADARSQYEAILKERDRRPDSPVVSRAEARLSAIDVR